MAQANFDTLCTYGRGGTAEVSVQAKWFFAQSGAIKSGSSAIGSDDICLRSLAKPWQFLAIAEEEFSKDWLIAVASHSGEVLHQKALESICLANGLDPNHLLCPESYPMSDQASLQIKASGAAKQKIWHPCSGKHLHFLHHARKESDPRNYTDSEHVLQRKVDIYFRERGVVPRWVTDSCALPTPILAGADLAKLWHQLATDKDLKVRRLIETWTNAHDIIGGSDRLDSQIVAHGKGFIIAKEGADGLLVVQTLSVQNIPDQTIFIKLAGGYQAAHLALGLYTVLQFFSAELNPYFQALFSYLRNDIGKWHPKDQPLTICLR